MKKITLAILIGVMSAPILADGIKTQCGSFILEPHSDGLMYINGIKPDTQKIIFLKDKDDYRNIKMQWMVPRTDYPGWYGMDYVKRNGKAILNVELVRSNMDQPRIFGSFDCARMK